METNSNISSTNIKPSFSKACSKCRVRRIKCSKTTPTCTNCEKSKDICDIMDNIFYNYRCLSELIKDVELHKSKINESESQSRKRLKPTISTAPGYDGISFKENLELNIPVNETQNAHQNNSIDKISVEVGSLSAGGHGKYYIGTATGISFMKMFLSDINIPGLYGVISEDMKKEQSIGEFIENQNQFLSYASIPPYHLLKYLWCLYLDELHIFYPILSLRNMRTIFKKAYGTPLQLSNSEKYTLFMFLALSSKLAENNTAYKMYHVYTKPVEYFSTAFKYFEKIIQQRNESSVFSLLLLILWALLSSSSTDFDNVWLMGRYCVSQCIELGLHRSNDDWKLPDDIQEFRNRL